MFNNDSYVGSTIYLPTRINQHKKQLKQGNHANRKMIKVFNECEQTITSIQILDRKVVSSNHQKLQLEQHWIDKMKPTLNLCNAHNKKAKVKCKCGSVVSNLRNHIKTNKHILYVCHSVIKEMIDNICVNDDKTLPKNPQNITITCQQ